MRILKISGTNLASLSGQFEIDLDAEPLRSAGLFAITGETGAGKSTILDALCLALYGNCPRLSAAGVNDDVPDISGETIKSSDARSILRHGANEGHAEALFVAPDGLTYRATWTARRARGKTEGRLQNVARSLTRVHDEKLLESQINAVRDRVVEITGLAYEEFRRTVLLAQGDFDAFLRANTPERAALLEKVTGTEIYRDISKRIYARCEEARVALEALEARRGAVSVLTDEERQVLCAERDDLGKTITALGVDLAAIHDKLKTHEAVTALRTQRDAAIRARDAARKASDEAAPLRTELGSLDAALSLRTESARLEAAEKAVSGHETAEKRALGDEKTLSEQVDKAVTEQEKTRAAADAAEQLFKSLAGDWSEATRLDGLVGAAQGEVDKAKAALTEALSEKEGTKARLDTLQGQEAAARKVRDAAMTELSRIPDLHLLADRWTAIDAMIEERIEARKAQGDVQKAAAAARAEISRTEGEIASLAGQDAADRKAIDDLNGNIEVARKRLAKIDADAPQTRMDRLVAGIAGLRDMRSVAREHAHQSDLSDRLDVTIRGSTASRDAAISACGEAETEIARAASAVTALEAPVDRAEAAVSEAASRLRQHLDPGSPCPVCGALEHPVEADDALTGLAKTMRADLETERARLETAKRAFDTGARNRDAAIAAIAKAETDRAAARGAIDNATAAFAEARRATLETGLEEVPESPAGAVEALGEALDALEARRGGIAALIEERSTLSAKVENDRMTVEKHRTAISGRTAVRDEKTGLVSKRFNDASLADQKADHARGRIEAIDRDIAPALAAVGKTPGDLDENASALRAKLSRVVDARNDRIRQRDAAEEDLKGISPKISAATSELAGAEKAVMKAREILATRKAALEETRGKRTGLLGGEDTETHRSRHNAARISTRAAKDEAEAALSDLRGKRSAAEASLRSVRDALAPARRDLNEAAADLDAGLKAAGLDRAALEGLLRKGAPEAQRVRATLKTIDEALTGAASTLAAREADLKTLMEKGVPEETEADLRKLKDGKEHARDEARERTGAITGKLGSDDEVRKGLKDLDDQIRTAKTEADTWAAVNEAVGSRQGGKFAQIAQGVTLSMLVERANQHLAELRPRYRLAQGGEDLALHIIDRDMGDEVRSTRSISGGERFLVSLSLALALSSMGGQGGLATTLFIDEGFGSLDMETLDVAMDALETLQAQGRTIGVISHVEGMKDRIPVQVRVTRRGAGASRIEFAGAA